MQTTLGLFEHLTHKANLKQTRFGWLRLTPAYSVHLVSQILDERHEGEPVVLDPFCGTGTTALVCAERGIACDTTDINPFLLWLARTKTRRYTAEDIAVFEKSAETVAEAFRQNDGRIPWLPPLHQIEKWWDEKTLYGLGNAMCAINTLDKQVGECSLDLLKITFLRVMIGSANVSFGHQSMSFKKGQDTTTAPPLSSGLALSEEWQKSVTTIGRAAESPIVKEPSPLLCDARDLTATLAAERYNCVITSPPYPNRMSYIRELRPYMYWLGYLENGRDAGELDWQAIGGTWGCATSNVGKWQPGDGVEIPHDGFYDIIEGIGQTSSVLSRYVHKYFYDMVHHTQSLFTVMQSGGSLHYVVGNSKFYDVLLPVEEIFASLFRHSGFVNVTVKAIRKRTSKKELYEYVVSAAKPT